MTVDHTPGRGMHGIEAVVHFLDRERAPYELIEHADTFAAVDEASEAGSRPARMAKTVLLHDHDGFRVAVIPASEQLDLHKAICGWRARMRSSDLLVHHRVFCSGGDHRHALEISPHEIERLGNPLVGDLCVKRRAAH